MAVGQAVCPGHGGPGEQALPPDHHSYFRGTIWETSFGVCRAKLSTGPSKEHRGQLCQQGLRACQHLLDKVSKNQSEISDCSHPTLLVPL